MKTIPSVREHHYLKRVSIFLVVAALIVAMPGCTYRRYLPRPAPPVDLEIRDWHDLSAIRANLGRHHRLMNDLDSTTAGYAELAGPTAYDGEGWTPMGSRHNAFRGTFDGQGYEIRDLFVDHPHTENVGLFGYVGLGGVIENVGVVDVDVTGGEAVGGLVGTNQGTVSNSYSSGSVSGDENVGGLVGTNQGTVSNSYARGSVTGGWRVGGLVGTSSASVTNSFFSGIVTGGPVVGGLAGRNEEGATLSSSYSSGSVTGTFNAGGLVGTNYGPVSNCYSTSTVTGDENVGGLVGFNDAPVSNSYSTGSVTGCDEYEWLIGGLVGASAGVSNSSFWDVETSGMEESNGGTGKTTAEMMNIATFADTATEGLDKPWDIIAVGPGETDPTYTWNIVDGQTYPFLSWQAVS